VRLTVLRKSSCIQATPNSKRWTKEANRERQLKLFSMRSAMRAPNCDDVRALRPDLKPCSNSFDWCCRKHRDGIIQQIFTLMKVSIGFLKPAQFGRSEGTKFSLLSAGDY